MVNAQSYPNLRPNSHSTICSQICGYTTRNHVYGQNKGDQPWVIFASGLRINNQQSRGIQPRMIRIYSIYIYIHTPSEWSTRKTTSSFLEGCHSPRTGDQSYARRPCSHDQGLYTLWGCHMVLLVQSYGWLPTGCNNVRYISKQQQQWFHTVRRLAKVKQARVETIGTRVFGCCGHGSLVVFCRVLSCFLQAPNTLPPWNWGRASASLGNTPASWSQ